MVSCSVLTSRLFKLALAHDVIVNQSLFLRVGRSGVDLPPPLKGVGSKKIKPMVAGEGGVLENPS